MTSAAGPQTRAPVGRRLKIMYGIGAVAYGVKDNGFGYFLLLFYSQILGLQPSLAGLALAIAMVLDAVSDPVVGHVSDNFRSRLGRRHPFMYAAILPVTLAFYLLWDPLIDVETASQQTLFLYMLALSVLVRTLITVFEVPNTALVAEFTDDYDQRTSVLSFRYFFGWWGGLFIALLAYGVFLKPTEANPSGLSAEAFQGYGLAASIMMFGAMVLSSLGTHAQIPNLRQPPEYEKMRLGRFIRDFWTTVAERSFLALFLSSLLFYTASGFAASAFNYVNFFFWELTGDDVRYMVFSQFFAALIALALVPRLAGGREKKHVAIGLTLFAVLNLPLPILLRLGGLFVSNDSPFLLPILLVHTFVEVAVLVMMGTMIASMIADMAEESEKKTKRRSEGVFFATRTFARKATSGMGVFILGVVLQAIAWPTAARPGEVPEDTLFAFALSYPIVYMGFGLASAAVLVMYRVTRMGHAENLRLLAAEDEAGTRNVS